MQQVPLASVPVEVFDAEMSVAQGPRDDLFAVCPGRGSCVLMA